MDTFRLTYPEWLRIEFSAYPLVLSDSSLVLRALHLDLDTYIHLPLLSLKYDISITTIRNIVFFMSLS